MRIFATEDRDEELKTIWESMVLRGYRMGDCHEEVGEAYLVTLIWQTDVLSSVFLVNAGP